ITDALAFSDQAVAAEPWIPTPVEIAAPNGQPDTPQEGNTMNSREYADAVRQLRANLKGRPLDDSPAYAALQRSEEHTLELQSLMHRSYAVLCLKKKTKQ